MVSEYQKAKDKFTTELRFLFPNSTNLLVEIDINNIDHKDFGALPLPHKQESIMGGSLKWNSASIETDKSTDTFNSEYL